MHLPDSPDPPDGEMETGPGMLWGWAGGAARPQYPMLASSLLRTETLAGGGMCCSQLKAYTSQILLQLAWP